MICPTVKIQSGDSYIVINESDFDETKHKLFGVPPAPKSRAKQKLKKKIVDAK